MSVRRSQRHDKAPFFPNREGVDGPSDQKRVSRVVDEQTQHRTGCSKVAATSTRIATDSSNEPRQPSVSTTANWRRQSDNVDQTDMTCRSMASAWLKALHVNQEIFGARLVNAPAWVMLVELYANERKRPLSISDITLASGAPQTSALRHLQTLERNGYVQRQKSTDDGRRYYVHLTRLGIERIEEAFLRTAESDKKLGLGRLALS